MGYCMCGSIAPYLTLQAAAHEDGSGGAVDPAASLGPGLDATGCRTWKWLWW